MKIKFFNSVISCIINKISISIDSVSEIKTGVISINIPAKMGTVPITGIGVVGEPVFDISTSWNDEETIPKIKTLIINMKEGIEEINNLQIDMSDCSSVVNWKKQIGLSVKFPDTISIFKTKSCQEVKFQDKVIIPKNVETIEESAFSYANFINGISFGSESKLKTIGASAFKKASINGSISFPNSLTEIGDNAFMRAELLLDIAFKENSNIKRIGNGAFSETAICHVDLPRSVNELGQKCFSSCEMLRKVDLSKSNINKIQDFAFTNCISLENVKLNNGLEVIGKYSLANCSFKSITFPETLVSIEGYALYHGHLQELHLPKSVTTICDFAFSENQLKLFDCSLLDTVLYLGNYAFSKNNFEELHINKPIPLRRSLSPQGVFSHCGNLRKVYINGTDRVCSKMFYDCKALANIYCSEDVEVIEDECFAFTGIKSLSLGSHITNLGKAAFMGCEELQDINLSKTQITEICSDVFKECKNITNVKLPYFLHTINDTAFSDNILTKSFWEKIKEDSPFALYSKFDM